MNEIRIFIHMKIIWVFISQSTAARLGERTATLQVSLTFKTSFCYLSRAVPHQLLSRFLWVIAALPGMCFSWELCASSPTETVCMKNSFASNLCSVYFIKASACILNQYEPQMGGFRQSAARLGRKPNTYPACAFLNAKKNKREKIQQHRNSKKPVTSVHQLFYQLQ